MPHASNAYNTITNVAACKELLRRSGRCFICLRRNHVSRDCRSRVRCHKCNGRHHIGICHANNLQDSSSPDDIRDELSRTWQPRLSPPAGSRLHCSTATANRRPCNPVCQWSLPHFTSHCQGCDSQAWEPWSEVTSPTPTGQWQS